MVFLPKDVRTLEVASGSDDKSKMTMMVGKQVYEKKDDPTVSHILAQQSPGIQKRDANGNFSFASDEEVKNTFGTADQTKAAKMILEKGTLGKQDMNPMEFQS